MTFRRFMLLTMISIASAAIGGYASVHSQQVTIAPKPATVNGRFEFEILQSFDARYLGDTPGFIGKHGELGDYRPQAALTDPVYRGDELIGRVSGLTWSKGHGSLEIEIDPEPLKRICVGDVVWLKLGENK